MEANAIKKEQLLILTRMGKMFSLFMVSKIFLFSSVQTEPSCLCLAPARSQNGLV